MTWELKKLDFSSQKEASKQKHVRMLLDFKLEFQEHCKPLFKEVNKAVALVLKFQNITPRPVLLTIHKCFVRTLLDYGDIIYDEALTVLFTKSRSPTI